MSEDDDGAVPPGTPPITPYAGGPIPEGHLVLKDQYGERHLIDIDAAKAARDKSGSRSSRPISCDGIEAFKRILSEHDLTSSKKHLRTSGATGRRSERFRSGRDRAHLQR